MGGRWWLNKGMLLNNELGPDSYQVSLRSEFPSPIPYPIAIGSELLIPFL